MWPFPRNVRKMASDHWPVVILNPEVLCTTNPNPSEHLFPMAPLHTFTSFNLNGHWWSQVRVHCTMESRDVSPPSLPPSLSPSLPLGHTHTTTHTHNVRTHAQTLLTDMAFSSPFLRGLERTTLTCIKVPRPLTAVSGGSAVDRITDGTK